MDRSFRRTNRRKTRANSVVTEMAEWTKTQIPNGVFFTGTYSNEVLNKKGWMSDDSVFSDFEFVLRQAGYKGKYFVAFHDNAADDGHCHAILEDTPAAAKVPYFWSKSFGGYKFGSADDGAYEYVANRGLQTGRHGDARYRENFDIEMAACRSFVVTDRANLLFEPPQYAWSRLTAVTKSWKRRTSPLRLVPLNPWQEYGLDF